MRHMTTYAWHIYICKWGTNVTAPKCEDYLSERPTIMLRFEGRLSVLLMCTAGRWSRSIRLNTRLVINSVSQSITCYLITNRLRCHDRKPRAMSWETRYLKKEEGTKDQGPYCRREQVQFTPSFQIPEDQWPKTRPKWRVGAARTRPRTRLK